MSIKIKVDDKTVRERLEKAIKVMASSKTEALLEVGERGVEILKKNTPVKDGKLRNSMSYSTNNILETPLNPDEPGDAIKKNKSKDDVVIGTNVIYGPSVEYLAKNGSQGFMQRSYDMLKPVAKKVMAQVIGRRFK